MTIKHQPKDGPGSPLGQGKTEHEAIDDLKEQMEEREFERAQRRQP